MDKIQTVLISFTSIFRCVAKPDVKANAVTLADLSSPETLIVCGCAREYVVRDNFQERAPMEVSWPNDVKPRSMGSKERQDATGPWVGPDEVDEPCWRTWLEMAATLQRADAEHRIAYRSPVNYPTYADMAIGCARVHWQTWRESIPNPRPGSSHAELSGDDNQLHWRGTGGRCPTGMAAVIRPKGDAEKPTPKAGEEHAFNVYVQLESGTAAIRYNPTDNSYAYESTPLDPLLVLPHIRQAAEREAARLGVKQQPQRK